jgi:hypothetical protein
MRTGRIVVALLLLFGILEVRAAAPDKVIIGVNIRGYGGLDALRQDAEIEQLQRYGVKAIREGFPSKHDERFDRFIIAASRHGISTVAIIYPTLGGTEKHTGEVDVSIGRRWRVPALVDADPDGFRSAFAAQLAALEDAGVKLTAFEIGNEFNTVGYNADFPAHGSSRVLGLAELNNPKDAEARQIAAGYLQYIKIMAVVKEVRDRSRLNRTTPIITGGLSNVGEPGPKSFNGQLATSIPDTLAFLSRRRPICRRLWRARLHQRRSSPDHRPAHIGS